jgi:hypothetical protein
MLCRGQTVSFALLVAAVKNLEGYSVALMSAVIVSAELVMLRKHIGKNVRISDRFFHLSDAWVSLWNLDANSHTAFAATEPAARRHLQGTFERVHVALLKVNVYIYRAVCAVGVYLQRSLQPLSPFTLTYRWSQQIIEHARTACVNI